MSFLWAREVFDSSGKLDTSVNDLLRTIQVASDDPVNDGPVEVQNYVKNIGIAYVGQNHPRYPDSWCRFIQPRTAGRKELGLWNVTCQYSNAPLSQREKEKIAIKNPLERPINVRWTPIIDQVPAETDRDGKRYRNPAGDPYDPPIMHARSRVRLIFDKNFATVPEWYWRLGAGLAINEDSLYIAHGLNYQYRPKSLRFTPGDGAEALEENNIRYFPLNWMIEAMEVSRFLGIFEKIEAGDEYFEEDLFSGDRWLPVHPASIGQTVIGSLGLLGTTKVRRFLGWDSDRLNRGLYYLDDPAKAEDAGKFDAKNKKRILDDFKHPVATPQLLNPDGSRGSLPSYTHYGDYPLQKFRPVFQELLSQ